jgi:trans-aconitate 2-methyltransferase
MIHKSQSVTMSTTTPAQAQNELTGSSLTGDNDWSPDQYLLFRNARNRPIHDLINFLGSDYAPSRIIDLGCGPGNSTSILAARFPHAASLTGVDSSPAMLTKARSTLPTTTFTLADLRTYTPPPPPPESDSDSNPNPNGITTLLFTNAAFQWLRHPERLPTITRLVLTLPQGSGSALALQMPDNHDEPSHRAMRETAASPGPWRPHFEALAPEQRPDLDPVEPHLAYYDALRPHCRAVETWTTRYVHVLEDGHDGIVEWVRGTGLQPFVNALPAGGGMREAFVEAYRARLVREYPLARDGRVLLAYPRRFVVAFR